MAYLVESSQGEHASIRKLEGLFWILRGFFDSLRLNPKYCWFLLEVEMSDLVPSFKGDVDILIGRLHCKNQDEFKNAVAKYSDELPNLHPTWPDYLAALDIAESGGIEWPPRTDYLAGIETKCHYLDPSATEITQYTIKSRKSSPQAVRKIRQKVERLVEMGFDKVALLEFIANPPATGFDSRAWTTASNIARASEKAVASVFQQRLSPDTVAGNWVCSIGSVVGGDETIRGSGGSSQYQVIRVNSYSRDQAKVVRRLEMESRLRLILGNLPQPRSFPALFINCKPCGAIHRSFKEDPCNEFYNAASGFG
jgi:hypothetical protein